MDAEKRRVIEHFLDHLIDPINCIDTFGRSYIDDLELILEENHGFNSQTETFETFSDLVSLDEPTGVWFERVCKQLQISSMKDFLALVRSHQDELDIANVRPRVRSEELYEADPQISALRHSSDTIDRVNELQRRWSEEAHKSQASNETDPDFYELYMNYDRVSPWTFLVRREITRRTLGENDRAVCIGNRWSGEVRYFRQNIGLKNAIGVDLFSADPEYVIAADMHKMPFDSGSVKLVFARGVANKSYDFRLFAKELRRVLAPDGFLIIEQPVYAHGVDVLGATDLKSSNNLLRLFRGQLQRIVYTDEAEGRFHQYTFNGVRLVKVFVQFSPERRRDLPPHEPFPDLRFHLHAHFRNRRLRSRVAKKLGAAPPPYPATPKGFRPRLSWSQATGAGKGQS